MEPAADMGARRQRCTFGFAIVRIITRYYSFTSLRGGLPALLLVKGNLYQRKPRLMELQEPAVTARTSPPKAEPRTRLWEQVVHLGGDPQDA